MKTIYKYPITICDDFELEIPSGFRVIHVGPDPIGKFCFWAEVDTDNVVAKHGFHIVGTGNPRPEDAKHLGSFSHGRFVWHLYDRGY